MKCPHCNIEFYATSSTNLVGQDTNGVWQVDFKKCPSCENAIITLINGKLSRKSVGAMADVVKVIPERILTVWPKTSNHPPCPLEIPKAIADDYKEACLVLSDSPKASAALSRRCLQQVLREAAKVKPGDLYREIQDVLDTKTLPQYIAEGLDAIRHIGNFAAHPIKSQITDQIVPVEPEEAEWTLNILEALFDFYYVLPEKTKSMKEKFNLKLQEAGKKPLP